jgi:hypothetical protein
MKQTAVEWLVDTLFYKDEAGKICINIHPDCDINYEIKRAKQMEKEQITKAYYNGKWDDKFKTSEKYYNETYDKK